MQKVTSEKKTDSLKRKGMVTVFDQAIVSGTRFLTTILVGKFCGLNALATYAIGFTFVVFGSCLVESLILRPLTVFLNANSEEDRDEYEFHCILQLFCVSIISSLATMAIAGVMYLSPRLESYAYICFCVSLVIPFTMAAGFARGLSFAKLKINFAVVIDLTMSIVQLTLLGLFIWFGGLTPVTAYVAMSVGGLAAVGVGVLPRLWQIGKSSWSRFRNHAAKNLAFGRWLLMAQVIGVLQPYIIVWVLAAIVDSATAGVYVAAETIVLISNPLLLALGTLATPVFAKTISKSGRKEFEKLVAKACSIAILCSLVFTLVIGFLSEPLLSLFFGGEFDGKGVIVWVLASGFVWFSTSILIEAALVAINRPEASFVARFIGMLCTCIAVVPLVVMWGPTGGACALVIGSAASTCGQYLIYRAHLAQLMESDRGNQTEASQ